MYCIHVYIPDSHLESVKSAMFAAGAGAIGAYDSCAWQTRGQGQFRPLDNARPYLGRQGTVERVDEWKLELVCADALVPAVLAALKSAHPYETPAYLVFKTEPL